MVRTKKGKGSSRQRYAGKGEQKLFHYGTELLVLILLVAAAFYTPQIIFGVQDRILCGDTVLSQRERMNVGVLSSTYEKSMAARMTNFAESLAGEENLYLSSQELEITSEIENYLYGERGLYQEIIEVFRGVNWLTSDIIRLYEVTQWKQYVIYSDNYAKGVNFILWYIEMENEYGERLKLLADAEDGKLYAIKAENNTRMWERDIVYEYLNYWNDSVASDMWCFFMVYYEGITEENSAIISRLADETMTSVNSVLEYYRHLYHPEEPYEEFFPYEEYYNLIMHEQAAAAGIESEMDSSADGHGADLIAVRALGNGDIVVGENAGYVIKGMGNVSYLLPFGNGHLKAVMETKDMEYQTELWKAGLFMYPDITIGIREIYEMIPEFA